MSGSRPRVLAAFAAVTLAATAFNLRHVETGAIAEGVLKPSFAEVCSFLRDRTPADATIVSWNPRVFALYTDKTSAAYPRTADPKAFEARMPGTDPMFLVVYRRQEDYGRLMHAFAGTGTRWKLVYDNSDFRVLERQGR
jgi:hypothetical protein